MIYLLGIAHKPIQVGQDQALASRFIKYLVLMVKKLDIGIICEEYSRFTCAQDGIKETTIKQACAKLAIKHRYCDPGPRQRLQIGIPDEKTIADEVCAEFKRLVLVEIGRDGENIMDLASKNVRKKYYDLRENYWLSKIKSINNDLIFVCGSDHLMSFSELLRSNNLEVKILKSRFDKAL